MAFEIPLEAAWVRTCSAFHYSVLTLYLFQENDLQSSNIDGHPCLILGTVVMSFLARIHK